ncbi:hypothetical protein GGR16_002409 [Chelatococcus caeni]|uniref:Phage neck terminator protein gp12-like domain-containing protein n=1 Tax=Chelatococcus caeni TaxID=1348468 RepID=A0A840BWQ7_9HYPH|nr:hypothetical protein [Chelatococcus caeni]MBB4017380.1 hypothetical protein [Chelatococcus caeni]
MANDSSTGGYLVPDGPPAPQPLQDDALDDFFQGLIVGLTGLPGPMVRPRWQPKPPKQPPADADWCAIGIVNVTPDDNAYVGHVPDGAGGEGVDQLQRHEVLDILASFYGPNRQHYAGMARDGLSIAQNREPLFHADMGFVGVGPLIAAPEFANQQWIKRSDFTIQVRRQVTRVYPVRNLLSAQGEFIADNGLSQSFTVEN